MTRHTSSPLLLLALCYLCASFIDVCQAATPSEVELLRKDSEQKFGRASAAAPKKLEQALSRIHKVPSFEDHMKVTKDSVSLASIIANVLILIIFNPAKLAGPDSADYQFHCIHQMSYLWYTGSLSWELGSQDSQHFRSQGLANSIRSNCLGLVYFFFSCISVSCAICYHIALFGCHLCCGKLFCFGGKLFYCLYNTTYCAIYFREYWNFAGLPYRGKL